MENSLALYIRKIYLEKTNFGSHTYYNKLNLKTPFDVCFDEAVISRNNWFLYGSGKPGTEKYKCTQIAYVKTDFKNYTTRYDNLELREESVDEEYKTGFLI